jgi:hypothetical protein
VSLPLCLFPSVSLTYLPNCTSYSRPLLPPAERLWALKPDFQCGGRKKREFAFSFALGAFAFALFFHRAFALFLLRAREPVLPGGRNSGQKAQKGPEKKKFGRKNLWPNYGRISSKVAEKGPKKFFERISFFYCYDKHSRDNEKNLFTILLTLRLNAVLRFMCKYV